MDTIDKHIQELLYNYDCVIVPDFGGFITSDAAAYIDKKSNIIYPPSKKILFNKNLQNNDGLLANRIAKSESVSYQEANQYLMDFKDSCFLSLNEKGRVEIERVGVLFFDEEKNIQFQQSKHNFLTKSFGLPNKFLLPIAEKTIVIKEKSIPVVVSRKESEVKVSRKSMAAQKPVREKTNRKRKATYLLPVLLIPALIGGVFMANQYGYVGNSKIQLSSLNPFSSKSIRSYVPRKENSFVIETADFSADLVTNNPTQNTVEEVKNEVVAIVDTPKEVVKNEVAIKTEGSYHLIGGCFSSEKNALSLVNSFKNKGLNSQIIDKNKGLFRVSVQNFSSRSKAKLFQEMLKKEEGLSYWVLKK